MSDQSAAIDVAHPPDLLIKTLNPILGRILRTPLGRPLGEFMLVRFTGRKSGRSFAVPVSAHELDGDLYAVLEAQWKYNFRDGADAVVHHSGQRRDLRGQLIADRATVVDIVNRLAVGYGPKKAQRTMGMGFRDGQLPTVADWEDAVARLNIAAIRFTPRP